MSTSTPQTRPAIPELLQKLLSLEFDYDDGDGMDFEPYTEFMSAADTQHWLRAWTGNDSLNGAEFLVFGQDGTGGYAAIWNVREGAPLLEQPVVFLGSEGEKGVVASTVYDFLWLLAGGLGPYEAVAYPSESTKNAEFAEFAAEHAPGNRKSALEVLAAANAEFPNFVEDLDALCR